MLRSELDYDLPPALIAQSASEPRDAARLLVLDRARGRIDHRRFGDVLDYFQAGELLVINDTRVIPARFFCRRATGGKIEALFLRNDGPGWRILLRGSGRLRVGEKLGIAETDVTLELVERHARGEWLAHPHPETDALRVLQQIGEPPLPPYIHRESASIDSRRADVERYQTVYARAPGAVAAPTAGLHFTPELLQRAEQQGVGLAPITLHVGPGTFTPIEVDELSQHQMHSERYEVSDATMKALVRAHLDHRTITAVGTTSARVLETLGPDMAHEPAAPPIIRTRGETDIFIYPPYRFRMVNRLITNFHLPGSTLLALVMAFASPDLIRRAYAEAIRESYRFYSYGDAMLIL